MLTRCAIVMACIALSACSTSKEQMDDAEGGAPIAVAGKSIGASLAREVALTCKSEERVGGTFDYAPTDLPVAQGDEAAQPRTLADVVQPWEDVSKDSKVIVKESAKRATALVRRTDGTLSARLELRAREDGGWFIDVVDACQSAAPWTVESD